MAISEQSQSAAAVATAYFGALARRDAEAMAALWAPGGVDHIAGQADLTGPDEVRAWFAALFAAFPDLRVSVVSQVAQDDHVAVHYHADGTFAGAPYNGMEPTGSRVRIAGVDLLRVRDGRIARNDAYLDGVAFPQLLAHWDGGPLTVAGTVEEGDDVSGFRVVHVPGHAPGMIALVRERDGLALTTDCFYTMDPQTSIPGAARVPHPAFNRDTEQARESVRKLAGIPLQAAWPGHAGPVTGDVRGQLLRAADGA